MTIFLDGVEQAGLVREIVAGTNVTVDSTDPLRPIVSSTGGGGPSIDGVLLNENGDYFVMENDDYLATE